MTSETSDSDSSGNDAEQMADIIAGRTDSVTAESDDVGNAESDPDWGPDDMAVMMGSDPDDITDPRDDAEEQERTDSEQRAFDAALPHEVERAADRGVTVEELYQRHYDVDVADHPTFGSLRRELDAARNERRSR